jgi:hypothetical protein
MEGSGRHGRCGVFRTVASIPEIDMWQQTGFNDTTIKVFLHQLKKIRLLFDFYG